MEQEVLLKIGVDSADVPKAINATKALEKQIELLAKALDQQRITQRQSSDGLSKIVSEYRKMGVNALDAQNRIDALNVALKKGIDAEKEAARVRQEVSEARARAETAFALAMQKIKEQDSANRALAQQAKAFGEAVVAANTYATANKSAADSASVFEAELRKQEAQIAKTARASQEQLRALREANLANKSAADSAEVFIMQMEREQAERLKLEAMYDRNVVAARVYENAVNNLNRAEQLGVISADRKAAELAQLNDAYRLAGASASRTNTFINQFGEGANVAGIRTNNFGMVAQQVGYQVGDFFVQIQSGTNAFVAFGQQATQLAGLIPGVAGAIAGIGISLVTAILAFNSRTSEAKEAVKSFEEALQSLQSSTQSLRIELESFRLGVSPEQASVILEARQLEEERLKLIQLIKQETEILTNEYGASEREIRNALFAEYEMLSVIEEKIKAKDDELKANQEAARELEKLIKQNELIHNGMMAREMAYYMLIGQEEEKRLADGERYHAAMIARQNAYYAIIKEGEAERIAKGEQYYAGMIALQAGHANKIKADEQARVSAIAQQYKLYADTRKEADALSESLGEAYLDAVGLGQADVSKGVSAAAQAALLLAQRLNISLGTAQTLIRLREGKTPEQVVFDPRDPRYDPIAAEAERLRINAGKTSPFDPSRLPKVSDGADGGSGGGAADEFTSRVLSGELLEAIKRAQEETALYEKEVQMLDSALSSGLITQMEYNSYVQQAKEAYGQASQGASDYQKTLGDLANFSANEMSSAFMSIVDGTKSASDAFRDMARAIIKQAFELAVINPIINSIFGGVSGFKKLPTLGGFAQGGAFIGGNVTAFANGGVVGGPTMFPMSGGRTGLMGEAGPEAIMPLKRTSSGKLGVVAEGGGAVTVNNNINVQGDNAAAVRQEIAKLMPTITEATKSAVIDARRRGGQMRAAFS